MPSINLSYEGSGFFAGSAVRTRLESEILPQYAPACRWFGGKARRLKQLAVEEMIAVGPDDARLLLVRVDYQEGAPETYVVPLQVTAASGDETAGVIAQFADGLVLRDALLAESFRAALLHLLAAGEERPGLHGNLRGERGHALPPEAAKGLPSRVLAVEQSNSSVNYDERVFLKVFRKLEEGLNPDVEITRFLSEKRGFQRVPPYAGALAYERPRREPQIVALALGLVKNEGDAWTQSLAAAGQYLALVRDLQELPDSAPLTNLLEGTEDASVVRKLAGPFLERVARLGQRTGETHLALATEQSDPAFLPEPFTGADQRTLGEGVRASAERIFSQLRPRAKDDPLVAELLGAEARVMALANRIGKEEVQTAKIRTHGDYHLGQVLSTGDDFILLDFEGEPQRSLAERKQKRSPLRDVAGMLRSFHYAAHSALNEFPAHRAELTPWAEAWSALMGRTFLRDWVETAAGACFLPAKIEEVGLLLHAFLLEKAIYEVGYEMNNRPTWLGIPIRGILQIVATDEVKR